jgi:uncharacterized protein (TIGR02246 family)
MIHPVIPRTWLLSVCLAAVAVVPAARAFDLQQARREIDGINRRYCETLRRGDAAGLMNFFVEDARSLQSNAPAYEGRAKIQATYEALVAAGITEMTLTTLGLWGNEGMLSEEGAYVFADKSGQEIDRGKYIVLWKKVGTEWKLFRDCFNSDLPPPPPGFDENEVRVALGELAQALQAADPTAWVGHYTKDAVFVAPDGPAVKGRVALLEMARTMAPMSAVRITPLRIEGSGSIAYALIRGTWVNGKPGPAARTSRVRSLLVLRKEADGNWRVAQELMHTDPDAS